MLSTMLWTDNERVFQKGEWATFNWSCQGIPLKEQGTLNRVSGRFLLEEECGGGGKREVPSKHGDMKKAGRLADRENRQEESQDTRKARKARNRTVTGRHI